MTRYTFIKHLQYCYHATVHINNTSKDGLCCLFAQHYSHKNKLHEIQEEKKIIKNLIPMTAAPW